MKEFFLISSNYALKLIQSQQQYLHFSRISWRSHHTNPALFLSPGVVYKKDDACFILESYIKFVTQKIGMVENSGVKNYSVRLRGEKNFGSSYREKFKNLTFILGMLYKDRPNFSPQEVLH